MLLAFRLWLALNAFPSYPDRVLSRRGEASSLTLKSQAARSNFGSRNSSGDVHANTLCKLPS